MGGVDEKLRFLRHLMCRCLGIANIGPFMAGEEVIGELLIELEKESEIPTI